MIRHAPTPLYTPAWARALDSGLYNWFRFARFRFAWFRFALAPCQLGSGGSGSGGSGRRCGSVQFRFARFRFARFVLALHGSPVRFANGWVHQFRFHLQAS